MLQQLLDTYELLMFLKAAWIIQDQIWKQLQSACIYLENSLHSSIFKKIMLASLTNTDFVNIFFLTVFVSELGKQR